ncbi:MAG: phage/plasmid primase, P4 family [Hyphomicrobium sp.]
MSKIQFFNEYNLCVVPVHHRSKKPKLNRWQNRRREDNDASEFSDDCNYGVVLGNASCGIVDIDLDCELARELAPRFLPATGWIFGRASAPKSHYIYKISGDSGGGRKFNVRGKFAEYRANGQMTVFPPSTHESGEIIEFSMCEEIGTTTQSELKARLSLMAICAVVLPHYIEGKRNEIVLALSGTLLTRGRSEHEVRNVVEVLCDFTGDEEKDDRLEAVRSTATRSNKGQPFTQTRHLGDLIGNDAMDGLQVYLELDGNYPSSATTNRSTPGVLVLDDQNDTGLAKLFADQVRDRVLFDSGAANFYVYREGVWQHDQQGLQVAAELDSFIQSQVSALRENLEGVPPDQCIANIKFLLKYRNRTNARNAIDQSRTFLSKADLQKLQGTADAVAVGNGLLGLKDQKLSPLKPEHYVTKRLAVNYDPAADCPNFKRVLSDAFAEDDDLIKYFQGIIGYFLTPNTDRQELYIFHGSGANGKSTLLGAINHILGPYADALMGDTIFEGNGSGHQSDLASMQDCRLAVVQEAESKFRLNAPRLKQLTGGDPIKVRALYQNPISFVPKFKIVVVCNKRPNLDAYDEALKRRIKLIPFDHVVPRDKRDLKLGDKLKAEASGILNFMLEGARIYFNGDIREPAAVREATKSYLRDHDSVDSFLKYTTIGSPGAAIGKGELYESYSNYCADEAMSALSKGEFGGILKKIGYADTRNGAERQWKGLRFRTSEERPDLGLPGGLKRTG